MLNRYVIHVKRLCDPHQIIMGSTWDRLNDRETIYVIHMEPFIWSTSNCLCDPRQTVMWSTWDRLYDFETVYVIHVKHLNVIHVNRLWDIH